MLINVPIVRTSIDTVLELLLTTTLCATPSLYYVSYGTYLFHRACRIVQECQFDNLATAQMFLGSFGLLYYTFMSDLVDTSIQHDWWITGARSWDHGPFSVILLILCVNAILCLLVWPLCVLQPSVPTVMEYFCALVTLLNWDSFWSMNYIIMYELVTWVGHLCFVEVGIMMLTHIIALAMMGTKLIDDEINYCSIQLHLLTSLLP